MVGYRACRIKQYLQEGRARPTETTINNGYDFAIWRRCIDLRRCGKGVLTANRYSSRLRGLFITG